MGKPTYYALAFALANAPLALANGALAGESELAEVLVRSADTPAEHEALARYFAERAEGARKEARRHRSMGSAYTGGKHFDVVRMKAHCEKLAALHEEQAKEYDGLAAMHRDHAE